MSNMCYNKIILKTNDTEELLNLQRKICQWIKGPADNNWLGNIVLNAKLGSVDTKDPKYCRCRGWLDDIWYDNDCKSLIIETNTAWGPTNELWLKLFNQELVNGYEWKFYIVEPNNLIFLTNDKDCDGKYNLRIDEELYDELYNNKILGPEDDIMCIGEDKILKILQYILSSDSSDFQSMLEEVQENHYFQIDKWDYVNE